MYPRHNVDSLSAKMTKHRFEHKKTESGISRKPKDWLKFILGLAGLGMFGFLAAQEYDPPGPVGEVLRRGNRSMVEATALFYSEVDEMPEYEQIVAGIYGKDE